MGLNIKQTIAFLKRSKNYKRLDLKERQKITTIEYKLETQGKVSMVYTKQLNNMLDKHNLTQDNKRSQLYRQFNYEKRKALKHWQKITDIEQRLSIGVGGGKSLWITYKPNWLDYNVVKNLSFMSNEEIEELIKKARDFSLSKNSNIKRIESVLEDNVHKIFESYNKGYITFEELKNQINILKRNLNSLGIKTNKHEKFIDKMYTKYNEISYDRAMEFDMINSKNKGW